jgi:hypothetical protein
MNTFPIFKVIEGETVFSVISRYHAIAGYFNHNTCVSNIFDKRKKRIHPYLPNALVQFSNYFQEPLEKVLYQRTLFPLFLATLDGSQAKKLHSSMLGTVGSTFHISLTPQYSLNLFAGHKYCPICAIKDLEKIGISYWHIEHQIPGITTCSKHYCYLCGIENDDAHLDRHLALPPNNKNYIEANEKDIELAKYSVSFFEKYKNIVSKTDLLAQILQRLNQVGMVTSAGNLKYKELRRALSDYWQDLEKNMVLGVPDYLLSFDFIGPMLRVKTRTTAHPIKYILLLCWLDNAAVKNSPAKLTKKKEDKSEVDNKILEMARSNFSMNFIENELGVSRCYIRKVLELNNVNHGTNSMKIADSLVRNIIIKGLYGYSIGFIADTLLVKPSMVEHIFCRTKGLSDWRKKLRHQKKVIQAIAILKSSVTDNPNWIRKDIKQNYSAEYFILYHHDKRLLEKILPPKQIPIPPRTLGK